MSENELLQGVKYLIEIVPNINEALETLITELEECDKSFSDLDSKYIDLEQQNKRYRELLTSKILKDLIRLEYKGNFFPDEKWDDFLNFKYAIEALERESE